VVRLLAASSLLSLCLAASLAAQDDSVWVGEAPPAIAAERLSGTDPLDLAALRGRVVIVDFWASWCRPCRSIMPALDGLHAAHHDEGLTVLGVAREPASRIRRHLAESPVGYTVGRDAGGTLARYGVRALPTLVLIDRRGLVREVFVGIDGGSMLGRLERLVTALLAEPPG
jgi:thiol-disulfide isomerase/thioredoxin